MKTKTIKGDNILDIIKSEDEDYIMEKFEEIEDKEECLVITDTLKINPDLSWNVLTMVIEPKTEWYFKEPPNKVDITAIRNDLNKISSRIANVYLSQMRLNAPKTYACYMAKI